MRWLTRALVALSLLCLVGSLVLVKYLHAATVAQQAQLADIQKQLSVAEGRAQALYEQQEIFMKIIVLHPRIDLQTARTITAAIHKYAPQFDVDYDLALAIMKKESLFDPRATSPVGAQGVMQIMPRYWSKHFQSDDFYDIDTSVRCGLDILVQYRHMYHDIALTLTAYNAGPKSVNKALREGRDPIGSYARDIIAVYDRLKTMQWTSIKVAYHEASTDTGSLR